MKISHASTAAVLLTSLLLNSCFAFGGDGSEPDFSTLKSLVELHLPGFSVFGPTSTSDTPRPTVVAGDFNGDGESDMAAILTETAPQRTYSDGSPRHSAFVVVFLKSDLAYSDYQAVFLLGHANRPRGYTLSVERSRGGDGPDTLIVDYKSYSSTRYVWSKSGLTLESHVAD